jgi:hypothetical protein
MQKVFWGNLHISTPIGYHFNEIYSQMICGPIFSPAAYFLWQNLAAVTVEYKKGRTGRLSKYKYYYR